MRQWFTISEIRAAEVPTLSEDVFTDLIAKYPRMSSTKARTRNYTTWPMFDLEFHITLFMLSEQVALNRFYDPIRWRIIKLGIHRSVEAL